MVPLNDTLELVVADFSDIEHRKAIIGLLNCYRADEMGGGLAPFSTFEEVELLKGLRSLPTALVYLVNRHQKFIGVAVCFFGFSTFLAQKALNIHDLYVLPAMRGKGVASFLLREIENRARKENCGRITLEVRSDNAVAKRVYAKSCFADCEPTMQFWIKKL